MRVTVKHPTVERFRTLDRDRADRYLAAGWTVARDEHEPSAECWCEPEIVQVPPDGPVNDVLEWVGDNTARAEAALASETRPDGRHRTTLTSALIGIIAGDQQPPEGGEGDDQL
jgi:hypothetical protein